MKKENEGLTFHSESAISRLSLWANIIGYTILVFALISFVYQLSELSKQWSQIAAMFSQNQFQVIAIFTSQIFKEPLVGVFYFLVLRGLSQLLNLGLDLYYGEVEVEEDDEEENEVTIEPA